MLDRIEFGAKRTIDHAAAKLDHEATDDRRVDFHVERDVLAGDRFERGLQGVEILVAELFGNGDIGGCLALEFGHQSAEGADHVRDDEQPAIGGENLEEFRGNAGNTRLFEHRGQRLGLRVGAENRAADQPGQVGAVGQHGVELVEISLDRIDGFFVACQLEQRRCITAGHSRNRRIFSSHNRALLAVKFAREKPSPRCGA